jgi:hypothetical protein
VQTAPPAQLEALAEWFRRQGHHVLKTASSYWHAGAMRVYQAFPYHWAITPSPSELRNLLLKNNVLGLRYSTPLAAPIGISSYHIVYEAATYPLEALPRKARHDIKKGEKHASIGPISLKRLAEEGWPLRADVLARQGREGAETEASWRALCLSAEGLPGFMAWAALHEDKLTAALLAFACGNTMNIYYQQSATEHLKFGVNNALTFAFTQFALVQPGIQRIFYGVHSLDAPPTVDQFKLRMNYTAQPLRQRVVFHPLAAPAFNPISYKVVSRLAKQRPSHTFSKAEGLIRFYLQGRQPIDQQPLPALLQPDPEAGE